MTLFFLLTLILLVSPNSTTFAQMKDQENTYRINDEMILTINHHNQGDIIVANHSENEDNEPLHGEHQDHPATSSHDSHTAHSEYGGPGGESKAAIYASALSVVMIFLFIGVTYIALRKHQKNSNEHYR